MPNNPTTAKRDYRQEVTDNIIKMLEEGTAPWQKPWEPGALEMPVNPTSQRLYRGGECRNFKRGSSNIATGAVAGRCPRLTFYVNFAVVE